MAINLYEEVCDKNQFNTTYYSSISKVDGNNSDKIDFVADGIIQSGQSDSKRSILSPYLNGEKVKLISRVTTAKRLVHKKIADFVSSYPLAANIYKANSHEFKPSKKKNKKIKKSVLTLPNKPVPLPQTCTVSDMNDSEYCNVIKNEMNQRKIKKRQHKTNRNIQRKGKEMEFYDRDARYCLDLDCSSIDLFENFTGIGNRNTKKTYNKPVGKYNVKAHDVWAVLRDVNRFQFQPSPPISDVSVISPLKKTTYRKRRDSKDTRYIESCRTEEFAYISRYELDNNSYSQSSFDRVTVIDKKDEISISQEFKEPVLGNKKRTKAFKPKIIEKTKSKNYGQRKENLNSSMHTVNADKENNLATIEYQQQNCEMENHQETSDFQGIPTDHKSEIESNKSLNITDEHRSVQSWQQKKSVAKNNGSKKDKGNLPKKTLCKSKSPEEANGITKVIFNNVETKTSPTQSISNTRLLTTTPIFRTPKLTQADIKRRLANIRFPLVILGKDQLSSTIRVPSCESLQFSGLEKQIWPFMLNWFNDGHKNRIENLQTVDVVNGKGKRKWLLVRNCNDNTNLSSDLKTNIPSKQTHANNVLLKENNNKSNGQSKTQSMRFKDKMMSFISGKKVARSEHKKGANGGQGDGKIMSHPEEISTQTQTNLVRNGTALNKLPVLKYPWGKGKRTSNFIENVIKKVKSGEYYSQEMKDIVNVTKEESSQTDSNWIESILPSDVTPKVYIEMKNDPFKSIPGFDESLSGLEIETFNKDHIAVKHCVTNVVLKFDIAAPHDGKNGFIKHMKSFAYVSLSENHTKVFKYKNTIVNAVLPAEICTILPQIMRNIIDSNRKLGLPELKNDKITSQLSTISEVARCECKDILQLSVNRMPAINLHNGHFSEKIKISALNIKQTNRIDIEMSLTNMLSKFLTSIDTKIIFNCTMSPETNVFFNEKTYVPPERQIAGPIKKPVDITQSCMALQPYVLSEKAIVPAYKRFTLAGLFERTSNFNSHINCHIIIPRIIITVAFFNEKLVTAETMNKYNISKIDSNRLKVGSVFDTSQQTEKNLRYLPRHNSATSKNKTLERPKTKADTFVANNRTRKRGFVRLYKKYKSMSNIPGSNNSNTSLNKINGIDEFLQALGSAKTLSSVLDGNTEKKILLSLSEIKCWISSITSRQALLIMLLCNKNDTANLMRYRPVILQGIAVNRITRVSELNMEIEVIEKENMKKMPQYEGITYIPASVETQDSLFEELCWIAKTTASDYQRPFDESSEHLLKSLLEKRKKLNPSYLRVMARYVGLGLLKSSK